ncbi:MAG TPA: hypoxanthine phosphoribosyltransferase [Limnochordales bacterium]
MGAARGQLAPAPAGPLEQDIQEVLLDAETLGRRVAELGQAISRDYRGLEPVLVGILKGGFLFLADLLRHITVPVTVDFMAISSYGAGTRSSGVVRILKDLDQSVEGRHVLVVEDIVDTGLTLRYLLDNLASRRPASVRACVLLDKHTRREVEVPLAYVGFSIPDRFVVGYGLDFAERYRNLPFVGVLKPHILDGAAPDPQAGAGGQGGRGRS